jgi:hypothetical protein
VSQENVELQRHAIEAFNARDIEAYIALSDPQIEVHSTFAAAGGTTVYHGHPGLRSWWQDLVDVWGEGIRIEMESYFDLGEQTLMFYVLHGRGRQSGVEVALHAAGVQRWRDGLTVYIKGYTDRDDALRDLGVSEDELEPIAP